MALPPASSPNLCLTHPDPSELDSLWASTAPEWKGGLTTSQYIEESMYLASLDSRHNYPGLWHTDWILVDKTLPIGERKILSSCETFTKNVLIRRAGEDVGEDRIFGIASVFTAPEFRRQGYARRMLIDLAEKHGNYCAGTILFSDIGKKFYSELGWKPLPGNQHLEFPAQKGREEGTPLFEEDLKNLCAEDEGMIRKSMATVSRSNMRMIILPDYNHVLWHHVREEFVCKKLMEKSPKVKGAMAGKPGSRVWVIWTHKFDGKPEDTKAGNTLYVLRLVIEKLGPEGNVVEKDKDEIKENLRIVIQSAQNEAVEWQLQKVKLWGPSSLVRELVKEMGIEFEDVEREDDGIASLKLNEEGGQDEIEWLANERYAWC
jgi:GNAT superfamily N-acetyltransferase